MGQLPYIFVDVVQPGDKGDFHITVSDAQSRQIITTSRLKEDRSAFEYLYTARMIEGGGTRTASSDDALAVMRSKERFEDLERYGQRLYQDLFGRDNALKKHMAQDKKFAQGANIILRLYDTASELWNIPWEYIHDGTQFLSCNPRFRIVRYLADAKPASSIANLKDTPYPLRILFVISSPKNAHALNVEAEIRRVQLAVKPAVDKGLIEIEYVEEGTLKNVQTMLKRRNFHVLHYSGHGSISSRGSFLVMEDDNGMACPIFLDDLLPVIKEAQSLRFVFLSACKAGNINETRAASGIATGLMKAVPSVMAMQFSILDTSATKFAESFYQYIGKGATLEEAISWTRKAMYEKDRLLGDFGVATLYVAKPNIRLLDATKERKIRTIAGQHDLSALPGPEPFIGRRDELNTIRKALNDPKIPLFYVWGMAGIGKSALVGQIIRRPGQDNLIHDVLLLRCDQLSPKQIIEQFQQWVSRHFPAVGDKLNFLTSDPRTNMKSASRVIKGKQLILVLDRVDALMRRQIDRHWTFSDPKIEEFFIALARTEWSISTFMTGRFRWDYLARIPESAYKEIHLSSMSPTDVSFIISEIDVFKQQKVDLVQQFFDAVGGHPATLEFVKQYLNKNPQFLHNPRLTDALAQYWRKSFLGKIFELLSESEREILTLMCVHDSVFNAQFVQFNAGLSSREEAAEYIIAWEILSIADFVGTDHDDVPWYIIPNIVRTYVTSSMNDSEKQVLHAQFADAIQEHFYTIIQNALEKSPETNHVFELQIQEEYATVLRHLTPILHSADVEQVQRYLDLSFTWQKHLREAGMIDQANEIALILLPLLHGYGAMQSTDQILKSLREKGRLNQETEIRTRYWEAVRLIDNRKYEAAERIINHIEQRIGADPEFNVLHAYLFERKGEISRGQRNLKMASKQWETALKMFEKLDDPLGVSRVLGLMAEQALYHESVNKMQGYLNKAFSTLKQYPRTGPAVQLEAKLTLYRGHYERLSNNDAKALGHYNEAISLSSSIGDLRIAAQAQEHMGYVYGLLKQYEIASTKLLGALDVYEKLEDHTGLSLVLMKLAVVQDFRGNTKEAYTFCQRALRIAKDLSLDHVKDVETLLNSLKRKLR